MSYPSINPKLENVSLALNRWNFACLCPTHRANYSWKRFSPITCLLTTIHLLQTDRQTDDIRAIDGLQRRRSAW